MKESENETLQQQSSYDQENTNLKKLMNLYKNHFEEATLKIEQLEKMNDIQRENFRQFSVKKEEESQGKVQEVHRQNEKERTELLQRISDLEKQLTEASAERTFAGKPYEIIGGNASAAATSFDNLSITEVYHQLMQTQRELIQEQTKRQETEVYLNQILRDIESKAPLIAKQKRDYQRIVQSHTQLTETLDGYVDENSKLKVTLHELENRFNQVNKDLTVVTMTNHDLIQQVQNLLKQQTSVLGSSGPRLPFASPSAGEFGSGEVRGQVAMIEDENRTDAHDVISTHLVSFNNIEELQEKNVQLLQTIRRLTTEREQQEALLSQLQGQQRGGNANVEQFNDLEGQVQALRADQEKSEEMMKVLIQQRDMYRSMVTSGDYSASTSSVLSPARASISATPSMALVSQHQSPSKIADDQEVEIVQLRSRYNTLQQENEKLKDRMSRYEESDASLNQELSKTKEEFIQTKIQLSSQQTEFRFLTERCQRFENQLKLVQKENIESLQRRSELEENILSLQKELHQKDNSIHEYFTEIRQLRDQYRQKEIDYEVSKASEQRLASQINDLKEELKRHSQLTEHLHRIEISLSSRAEEEKQFLLQEKEALKTAYDSYRRSSEEKLVALEQSLRIQEREVKTLSNKLETKEQECISLQRSFLNEQSLHSIAAERIQALERQIMIQQEKFTQSTGTTIVESVLEKELQEKEIQLSKVTNELESQRSLVKMSEQSVEQFKRIAQANEILVKELKEKQEEESKQFQLQYQTIVQQYELLKQETATSQSSSNQLLQDLENSRQELQQKSQQYSEHLQQLVATIQQLTQEKLLLQQNYEVVKSDADKLQQASLASFENYERELQLHAESEKKLREERGQHAKTKEKLLTAEEKLGVLSADLIKHQQKANDDLSASKAEIVHLNELLSNLQQSNDLLHQQVQSYGQQVEKFQNERYSSLTISNSESAMVSDVVPAEEVVELRKNLSEMRELLRYLKRDKEMLLTRLNVVESENHRYSNQIQSYTKTIDELRQELKQEIEKKTLSGSIIGSSSSVTFRTEEEFQILMTEIQQLNILRESNLHLRKENEEIQRKLKQLGHDFEEEQKKLAPLQEKIRNLSNDKEALELANDQLTNDIAYWKNRLHALVSRYNDIDPHEHQQLKSQLEESKATVLSLQQKVQELENSRNEALSSKEKEIASAKSAAEGAEKNANMLREKLRQFKEKNTSLDGQIKELNKQNAAKDATHVSLEQQNKEAQNKITELISEIAELKSSLQASLESSKAVSTATSAAAPTATADASAKTAAGRGAPGRVGAPGRGQKRPPPPSTAPPISVPPTADVVEPVASATVVPADIKPPPPSSAPPVNVAASTTTNESAVDAPVTAVTAPAPSTVNPTIKPGGMNAMRQLLLKRKNMAAEEKKTAEPDAVPVSSTEPPSEDQPRIKRTRVEGKPTSITTPSKEEGAVVLDEKANVVDEGEPSKDEMQVESKLENVKQVDEAPPSAVVNEKAVEPATTTGLNPAAAPFVPFSNPFARTPSASSVPTSSTWNNNPFGVTVNSGNAPTSSIFGNTASASTSIFSGLTQPLTTIPESATDAEVPPISEEGEADEELVESQGDAVVTEEENNEESQPAPQPILKTTSKSIFGEAPIGGGFGSFASQPSTSTSIFGQAKPTAGFGLFGSGSNPNPAPASGGLAGLFGSKPATTSVAPIGSLFGAKPAGGASIWGSKTENTTPTASTSAVGGFFGSQATSNSNVAPTNSNPFSSFGSSNPQTHQDPTNVNQEEENAGDSSLKEEAEANFETLGEDSVEMEGGEIEHPDNNNVTPNHPTAAVVNNNPFSALKVRKTSN